jgi:predicted cupin superfamily sugar epimerase
MPDPYAGCSAQQIMRLLDLSPHPEGGFFRETFRDSASGPAERAASTAIYFLLEAGQVSDWHRIDAAEVWHFYAGAPLVLTISENGFDTSSIHLGANLLAGQHPQYVVPPQAWQTAISLGAWSLAGCTVAPGFDFANFELAPKGWSPSPREF